MPHYLSWTLKLTVPRADAMYVVFNVRTQLQPQAECLRAHTATISLRLGGHHSHLSSITMLKSSKDIPRRRPSNNQVPEELPRETHNSSDERWNMRCVVQSAHDSFPTCLDLH